MLLKSYPWGYPLNKMPVPVRNEWKNRYYPVIAILYRKGIPYEVISAIIGVNFSSFMIKDIIIKGFLPKNIYSIRKNMHFILKNQMMESLLIEMSKLREKYIKDYNIPPTLSALIILWKENHPDKPFPYKEKYYFYSKLKKYLKSH